ncbi:hypothetical protein DFJ73DRAFT_823933 [Zopfochytrium polystomum]|nr:hypothetical protein DFJ73DRAFT_823933 [Zopfochytrium polystomum]
MHGLWLPSELPQARAEPAVSATSSPPFELWKCPLCLRASFESSGNWSTSCQCLRQTCIHYRTPGSCHDCWLLLWDPLRRDALQYPPGLRPSPTKDWSSHSRRTETSGRGDRLWDPRAVIQNAIYVNGVPSELLHGECIVSSTLFGRLGKISQVVIGCAGHPHRPLGLPESPSGVFVWFSSREEAETAIKMINSKEPSFEGMSATFCTTPFCPAYLRSRPCVETQCYLVHNNLSPPCNSTYSL